MAKISQIQLPNGDTFDLVDEKVTQNASTSNTPQPILFRNNVSTSADSSTEQVRYASAVTVTPSTGTINATKFNDYILAGACAKAVDNSISTSSSSNNLPTSAAVASFVEGKGYITSYTDEKVKQIPLNGLNSYKGLLFSNGQGNSQITSTAYTTDKIMWSDYERSLYIYDSTGDKYSVLSYDSIGLVGVGSSYRGFISFTNLSNNRSITFPNKDGTIALTSDISTYSRQTPASGGTTLSLVNTGDMYTWNQKQDVLVSGTNIKTINNTSILGSGNISITSGLQNLVDGSATGSVRGVGTTAESSSYTIGTYAFAEGSYTVASGANSHAEGSQTRAEGSWSHAEGSKTQATGLKAHAEGFESKATGEDSHAEGCSTTASGIYSHAEGYNTKASNDSAHTEGFNTTASGLYSHAEGYKAKAEGKASHAQNEWTIAQRKSQTALGEYNIADSTGTTTTRGDYAVIIGNGTADNARSNALTVDWSGNVDIASGAHYKINGSNLSASDVGAQATLVSGTNIKTINNQSLLGSGNISIQSEPEIFIATYGVTTYAAVAAAYTAGKTIYCKYTQTFSEATVDSFFPLICMSNNIIGGDSFIVYSFGTSGNGETVRVTLSELPPYWHLEETHETQIIRWTEVVGE